MYPSIRLTCQAVLGMLDACRAHLKSNYQATVGQFRLVNLDDLNIDLFTIFDLTFPCWLICAVAKITGCYFIVITNAVLVPS